MQIKQQQLIPQLQKKISPLYILTGQDNYLIEESLSSIKNAIKRQFDYDEKIITVNAPDDWITVKEEANSYSLFSDTVLINILYDKKTIDAAGKKILTEYLKIVNSRCFIIIRAPNIPTKQLQWLSNHEQALIVIAYPLNSEAMRHWIANQFKNNSLSFDPQVTEIIHHYTQGNMLASAQVIEKIALSNAANTHIKIHHALEHLSDQCDHNLFELVNVCLSGQSDKTIHILRHAANNKTEPTLVLWLLSQEIRVLLQLFYLNEQGLDIRTACNQLKIWSQQINLYQNAYKRLNAQLLQQMLHYCQLIDEQIKSSLNTQVWNALEKLALSLCLGRWLGEVCSI